jgi:hypothetical protein
MVANQLPVQVEGRQSQKGRHPMIGASKILTVSYGTFSCTLEGFDEPFSTMKAIAEYFRDLAAEDRYFGAVPPTPDAAMLHRIAEREIHRRVEARVDEHGVVLRQAEASPDTAPTPSITITTPAAAAAPAVVAAPVAVAPVAVAPVAVEAVAEVIAPEPELVAEPEPEPEPVVAEAVAEAVAEIEETEPEPEAQAEVEAVAEADDYDAGDEISLDAIMAEAAIDQPEPEVTLALDTAPAVDMPDSDPESLAAKLMRIRAVVEDVRNNRATEFEDDQEEDLAATGAPALSDDFGFDLDLSDDVPELRAAEEARAAARAEPVAVAEDEIEAPTEVEETADAADAAYDEIMVDEIDDGEWEEEPDLAALIAATAAPEATAEAVAEVEATPEEASPIAAEAVADTVAEVAEESHAADEISDEDLMSRISALGITAEPDVEEAAAPVEVMVEETAETAEIYEEGEPVEADEPQPSFLQRARARVIRFAKSGDTMEDQAEIAPSALSTDAEPETDFDDVMENVARAAAEDDPAEQSDARAILEAPAEKEGDFDRLMEEAKNKLEGVETRRRFSAISHLKAAVAATLADRKMQPADKPTVEEAEAEEEISLYRDDLSKAVRPRRPASDGSSTRRPSADLRPAPLVLVSAQRVDRPDGAGPQGAVVRPRRIAAGNLAVHYDEDEDDIEDLEEITPESVSSFAEFADRLGATTMTELLEAAAVYTASVEGRETFSRPHILRKVEFVSTRGDYNREDGLRSFGMLLRQGKIQKVARGQFAVSDMARHPQ